MGSAIGPAAYLSCVPAALTCSCDALRSLGRDRTRRRSDTAARAVVPIPRVSLADEVRRVVCVSGSCSGSPTTIPTGHLRPLLLARSRPSGSFRISRTRTAWRWSPSLRRKRQARLSREGPGGVEHGFELGVAVGRPERPQLVSGG